MLFALKATRRNRPVRNATREARSANGNTGVTFRCSGLDAGHPSMRQSGAGKQHPRSRNEFRVGRPSQRTMLQAHSCHGSLEDFADQDHGQIVDVAIDAGNFPAKGSANDDNPEPNNGPDQAEIAATELEALDYLMSNPSSANLFSSATNQDENLSWPSNQSHEFMPLDQIIAESPDVYASYYPNPAYEELHTVLHHHMVETARSTALTRQGTPEATSQDPSTTRKGLAPGRYTDRAALASSASLIRPLGDTKLTSRRELELWQNYLDEVAIWLDMFDVERHFQLKIPMMAKSADHLHYSILALSARQMERKDPDKPYTESLALYQEAIELIVQELHSLDTAVIASCVLLCVLEMMSSSPRAWGRHLDGCAMLLQAAGINGTVSGVRQALFCALQEWMSGVVFSQMQKQKFRQVAGSSQAGQCRWP
jgi:hypothetical protein